MINLKMMCQLYGKTLYDIADHCEVSPQAVTRWSKGRGMPSYESFLRILGFFDLTEEQVAFKKPLLFSERILPRKKKTK